MSETKPTKQDLEIQLRNLQEKRTLLGAAIHKAGNSLMMAKPNSKQEQRLIDKLNAYRTDYLVYDDEIRQLETQLSTMKSNYYLSTSTTSANTTYGMIDNTYFSDMKVGTTLCNPSLFNLKAIESDYWYYTPATEKTSNDDLSSKTVSE